MEKKDDTISRAAACECIGKMIHEYREKGEYALADGMILARRYGIKCLPAVDAAPVVHAHWIKYEPDMHGMESLACSACDYLFAQLYPRNYCPFCGAKMDEEGE